jgi:hypothetical protein
MVLPVLPYKRNYIDEMGLLTIEKPLFFSQR